MKIDLYGSDGVKKGEISVSDTMFAAKINPDLMHRVIVRRLANARNPIAHTRTRAEVAGTRAKAFRQKGTGRARRGSLTTNILRSGGVAHGPRNTRNFSKNMPKKERRVALFSSLSVRAGEKKVFALENFAEKSPKTKKFAELLEKLPAGKKYLFVLPARDEILEKSAANLPEVATITANFLNPRDILHAEQICFVGNATEVAEQIFNPKK